MRAVPPGIEAAKLREMTSTCACLNARRMARLLSQLYDAALRPAGVRSTQLPLLASIGRRGPTTISELADAVVVDRTTLTRSLALLKRKRWIRSSEGADLRTRAVSLTPRGWHVLREAVPLWDEAQVRVARLLGQPQTTRLLAEFARTVEQLKPAAARRRKPAHAE